jgi:dipeptidyl aminopeptidase/acylaminoacyl peptidase
LPTLRPTVTPVTLDPSLPLPTGRIYFLWDPNPIPEDPGLIVSQNNLYKVTPWSAPNNWQIEPAIEMFGNPVIIPSPDSAKLAMIRSHDINDDGIFDMHDVPRSDPLNIFVYDITDSSSIRLTDNQWQPGTVSWLPDSQRLSYPQLGDVLLVSSTEPFQPKDLYTFDGNIDDLAWSPDGKNLAIIHGSGRNPRLSTKLDFFQSDKNQIITVIDNVNADLGIIWSPDSQWIALTETFDKRGLSIVNANSHEIMELAPSDEFVFFAWDPSGQQLAFTHENTLSLWNATSLEVTPLASMDALGFPSWSPDGIAIAVGFAEGEQSGLLFVNPADESQIKLELGMFANQPIWSPDGKWLLFSSELDNRTGLYLVHKNDGIPSLFLETTDRKDPYNIYWLPEQ